MQIISERRAEQRALDALAGELATAADRIALQAARLINVTGGMHSHARRAIKTALALEAQAKRAGDLAAILWAQACEDEAALDTIHNS